MEVFQEIFNFIWWFFSIEIPIGNYSFSLIGAILFFGSIAVILRFLYFFFDIDV